MVIETSIELELDDSVINVVDDEWRKQLYDLNNAEEIAEHIGLMMAAKDFKLSQLDGWADQPDDNAKIKRLQPEWVVTYIKEIK